MSNKLLFNSRKKKTHPLIFIGTHFVKCVQLSYLEYSGAEVVPRVFEESLNCRLGSPFQSRKITPNESLFFLLYLSLSGALLLPLLRWTLFFFLFFLLLFNLFLLLLFFLLLFFLLHW